MPDLRENAQIVVETLKYTKYPLRMNPEHLSEACQTILTQILLHDKRLATAYYLKEDLCLASRLLPEGVGSALMKWKRLAWSSRNELLIKLQRKIKLSIRMANGFRKLEPLISLTHLRCSGLPVILPGRFD